MSEHQQNGDSTGKGKEALGKSIPKTTLGIFIALGVSAFSMFETHSSMNSILKQNGKLAQDIEVLQNQVKILRDQKLDDEKLSLVIGKSFNNYLRKQKEQKVLIKERKYSHVKERLSGEEYIYGNPNATLTLIEYSDIECHFCKKFHTTPKQIVDSSNGNVNWVFKHLPLNIHNPAARREAHATECVGEIGGNRKFWMFTDELFRITQGNGKGTGKDLAVIAESMGIDPGVFNECMASGKYLSKINSHMAEAKTANISGTPGTIVFNSTTKSAVVTKGAQPASSIMKVIKRLREEENNNREEKTLSKNN